MKLKALREQRAVAATALQALVNNDTAWTADHDAKYAALTSEIEGVDASIDRYEKALALAGAQATGRDEIKDTTGVSAENAAELRRDLLCAFLRDGRDGVRAALETGRFAGIQAAQSVGTPAGGGYLVPKQIADQITAAMKEYGGVRDLARIIQTGIGNPIDFPTANATAEMGRLIGENATVTGTDTSFGVVTLSTYKYSSDSVAISLELLQDSAFDIESYITELLGMRLGRITNSHYTNGTGVGQPQGIVVASSVGKVGLAGQTTGIILDDLIDLVHSVDPAYRRKAGFMLADSSVRVIKKLKDTTGRPLWLPAMAQGEPDTILNFPYAVNQDMPAMAANAKSVLFGDFSKYVIRDEMGLTMYRNTDSKYNEAGQVGFHALMRTGGVFTDVGGAVKSYQNSAT